MINFNYDNPSELDIRDISINIHPSLLFVYHDYACPVCHNKHAVYSMQGGIFQPCWECQKNGYRIVKKIEPKNKILAILHKLFYVSKYE